MFPRVKIMTRNCPNCAAPYDVSLSKCPYCGTSYFDLSAIDPTGGEPIYLKIKIKLGNADYIVTQLVKPNCDVSITYECDTSYAYGGKGNKIISFKNSSTLKTNLNFKSIPDKKGSLMNLEIEK